MCSESTAGYIEITKQLKVQVTMIGFTMYQVDESLTENLERLNVRLIYTISCIKCPH